MKIDVSPTVVLDGGSMRITCRVPRNGHNRGLTMGFENYTTSFVQLEGETAVVTHQKTYQHVPCDAGRAFCQVVDNTGHAIFAYQSVLVSCE